MSNQSPSSDAGTAEGTRSRRPRGSPPACLATAGEGRGLSFHGKAKNWNPKTFPKFPKNP